MYSVNSKKFKRGKLTFIMRDIRRDGIKFCRTKRHSTLRPLFILLDPRCLEMFESLGSSNGARSD